MSANRISEQFSLGFMSALEVDGRGYVGGLLVTSRSGRPLEFQCTTPVKPDRTQEILYGRTLRAWVLGELIGSTLFSRVSIKPDLIVVYDKQMLELRNHIQTPVAFLDDVGADTGTSHSMGGRQLYFHPEHPDDSDFVENRAHLLPGEADLQEPMDRVREALAETVRTVLV